ncbi:MAG: CoA transferase, partial [Chloroflexi bacterium]|nr:CoA transferase [Chloroflexota bacterium]
MVTSITPFGQTGPYRDFNGSDIVCLAMSGLMYVIGDSDRQPVRLTADQAYLYAGAEATSATVAAHYRREATGEGQHIDVSVQEAIAWTMGNESRSYEINKTISKRRGRAVQGGK